MVSGQIPYAQHKRDDHDLPEWIGLEYGLGDFSPASFLNRSKLEAIPKQPARGPPS
jgi:hypothetical protein